VGFEPLLPVSVKPVRHDSHPFSKDGVLLSEVLKGHRRNLEISQEELAIQLGVSFESVKNCEMGEQNPTNDSGRFDSPS
jgi:DNA-binding transcriptional regulator YiaG